MNTVKPKTLHAIIASILMNSAMNLASADVYELVSHTLVSPDGHVNSQMQGDFTANGIMMLEDGRIEVQISLAQPATGYTDLLEGSGTFKVGEHGVEIRVEYKDGRKHKGILANPDPNAMVIVVSKDGFTEINVWREANPFLRNQ